MDSQTDVMSNTDKRSPAAGGDAPALHAGAFADVVAVCKMMTHLSSEMSRLSETEKAWFDSINTELDRMKDSVATKNAAIAELKARIEQLERERDQLVEKSQAQVSELVACKAQCKGLRFQNNMQVAMKKALAEIFQNAAVEHPNSVDGYGPLGSEHAAHDQGSVTIEEEPHFEDVGKAPSSLKRHSGSVENRPQKRRRGVAATDSEARVVTLIQELEDKKPWDSLYENRPQLLHTFKFDTLHPDARSWIMKLVKYRWEFRRELWENQHWITIGRDWLSLQNMAVHRGNRRIRARDHWTSLKAEGQKLITQGLISKDVFTEPFIWGFPPAMISMPRTCETVSDVAHLDGQEPARCFYSNKLKDHPFYTSGLSEHYPEANPFQHNLSLECLKQQRSS